MSILSPIDPTTPVSAYDPSQALHTPGGVLPPILSGGQVSGAPDIAAASDQLAKRGLLSHDLGKEIYSAEQPPEPTADPGSMDYYKQRQQQLEYDKEHPWGSPISAHPGVLGKIFHGLATAGNIAGDIFAPGTMSLIPGTQLNKTIESQNNLAGIERAGQLQNRTTEANATGENADTAQERADTEAEVAGQPKTQKPEPIFDKNGQVVGFNTGTELIGLHNPKLTPDMKEIAGLAQPKQEKQTFKAVTLQLPGGKKAAGKVDQEGNLLTANGEPAPSGSMLYQQPNYGQLVLPTKTQTVIGENGLPTIMGWNAQTQEYDRPMGTSATGAYGHEIAQAGAVGRAGNDLITQLGDPTNRAILGKLSSYIQQGTLGTPLADERAADLSAQLKTFAALQPAMHGFRSRSAQEAFEKIIGGLAQNPDATIGAIRGILKTAGAINPNMNKGEEPTRPSNVPDGYIFKDGPKGKGWYKP